jgi:HAD superfamily hydrolase (TIGR01457 family)
VRTLADRYDAFLFDLDGVLYRGPEPVEGAASAVEALRGSGKRLAFMTNNSSRTPQEVVEHLRSVGIAAAEDEVETSARSTGRLLADRGARTGFVIGERGLREAVAAAGVRLLEDGAERGDAVVVGWDREVDFAKLRTAAVLVQRGAALIASNADPSYPAPDGLVWPGAGAILAAVEATTGVRAEVVGKPHAPIFRAALERAGGGVPLVIGDRLETDVAGAAELGWDSLLVLTGIASRADAERSRPAPTFVADDLSALVTAG